jgi:PAS domain-containing protein
VSDVEDLRRENDALRRRNEQLVHQVADAQQAVEALARGEVDAVTVGASATPLLVHEAQERLRDDRRRDRRALVEAEERFRLLFEEAPVGMLMMSAGGESRSSTRGSKPCSATAARNSR